jgi:hypothetical protein
VLHGSGSLSTHCARCSSRSTPRRFGSDGGLLLVRQLDEALGLTRALAAGLPDERQWLEQLEPNRERVVLDIDATDDPTHGHQQLTFFHGFYDQYMDHPMLVYDAEDGSLVTMLLRPGNTHSARGAMGVLSRLIREIRARCSALWTSTPGGKSAPSMLQARAEPSRRS